MPQVTEKEAEKATASDTGLGLSEFLSGSQRGDDSSSSEAKTETAPPTKTEKKSETKEIATETETKTKAETVEEKKSDAKAADTAKVDNKHSVNWDGDENPYKKRYYDTAKWANTINQELAGIRKDITVANKKLDGTYDPEAEKSATTDPAVIAKESEVRGKVAASHAMAEEKYGKEYVHKTIFADDAPFRQFDNDAYVQGRVLSSNAPVMEAIRILKEREFFSKYGHEPEKITANIRSEVETELRDKITKEVTDQIMKRLNEKEKMITGVGGARDSETKTDVKQTGFKKLSELFPN